MARDRVGLHAGSAFIRLADKRHAHSAEDACERFPKANDRESNEADGALISTRAARPHGAVAALCAPCRSARLTSRQESPPRAM